MNPQVKLCQKVLSEREAARQKYATAPTNPERMAPEEVFYSVDRSRRLNHLNRYSNIFAYDRTAVRPDGNGYTNANVVVGESGQWWVASQAPTLDTIQAFFHAIQTNAASQQPILPEALRSGSKSSKAIIVQLTGWEELGRIKADRYFLDVPDKVARQASGWKGRSIHLIPTKTRDVQEICSTVTELELQVEEKPITTEGVTQIHHYHFKKWPDHGVPFGEDVKALYELVMEVDRKRKEFGNCEVWVHCSAGVGRPGVFIALSSLLCPPPPSAESIKEAIPPSPLGPLPPALQEDRVARTIDGIREWRGGLVQNADQLSFVYQMVAAYGNREKKPWFSPIWTRAKR